MKLRVLSMVGAVLALLLTFAACGGSDSRITSAEAIPSTEKSADKQTPGRRTKSLPTPKPASTPNPNPPSQPKPTSSKPQGSWAGLQYAVEQEGWNSKEAAEFVLQMAQEGLSSKRAQGTAAAAFVLEEHGYSHRKAVRGARETEAALEGVGR